MQQHRYGIGQPRGGGGSDLHGCQWTGAIRVLEHRVAGCTRCRSPREDQGLRSVANAQATRCRWGWRRWGRWRRRGIDRAAEHPHLGDRRHGDSGASFDRAGLIPRLRNHRDRVGATVRDQRFKPESAVLCQQQISSAVQPQPQCARQARDGPTHGIGVGGAGHPDIGDRTRHHARAVFHHAGLAHWLGAHNDVVSLPLRNVGDITAAGRDGHFRTGSVGEHQRARQPRHRAPYRMLHHGRWWGWRRWLGRVSATATSCQGASHDQGQRPGRTGKPRTQGLGRGGKISIHQGFSGSVDRVDASPLGRHRRVRLPRADAGGVPGTLWREDAHAHPTEAGLTQGMEWPEGVGRGPEPQGLVQRTRRSATARVALFLNGPRSGPAGG